jgi:uncharacterized membrane protein YeiB
VKIEPVRYSERVFALDVLRGFALFMVVVAVYASQVLVSNLLLRWFRFGPVEWLWRSLTYGRAQPMRVHTRR